MSETNNKITPYFVSVGILSENSISFVLNGKFSFENEIFSGEQFATINDDKISWNGKSFRNLMFIPTEPTATFTLKEVTIGIHFHWERKESETFCGSLKIIREGEKLTAINIISVEDYLTSVISSEMKATSSIEYLRSQAVVSRSWLMRILLSRKNATFDTTRKETCKTNGKELIKWYENDAHTNFDVCADDHCQRYEGITRVQSRAVHEAVFSTRGEVIMYDGNVCDARFSKCCGGITEIFSTCWDEHDEKYLVPEFDSDRSVNKSADIPDLTIEAEADKWIRTTPEAFCNTHDKAILSQVLNDYDFETKNFYRWNVEYNQDEISTLISSKQQVDFGQIIDLKPGKRGPSGRLITLHIHGTKRDMTIGKELEIRRTLSPSHLMSSAFVVDRMDLSKDGIPARFKLTGAGWGHGVGMCQIGAAVMAAKGYDYKTILKHYYKNSEITKLYD